MINRNNFKNFIDEVVSPYAKVTDADLRVDQYANFEVYFTEITTGNFASSPRKYTPLGAKFLSGNDSGKNDMHKFIRSINDVEMNISSKPIEMPGASYALHRLMPMNSQSNIVMQWLSTKTPFIETLFIPWMQDNTINGIRPLVKVDMTIKFPLLEESLSNKIEYKYYGLRPIEVGMHKMSNEPHTDFYRKVTFDFDYFWVENNGVSL